ncbi:MAG: hypothetical protein ACREC6_10160, partial [Hyphomicrobiaceae bacterium]
MTTLLEKALEVVRGWPDQRQNDAALLLLALDRLGSQPYSASPDELRAIDEALAQTARGEFASDEDVEAVFARFRRSRCAIALAPKSIRSRSQTTSRQGV